MNNLTLTVGTQLIIRGKNWKIVNISDNDNYFLENEDTKAWQQKRLPELIELYGDKKLSLNIGEMDKREHEDTTGALKRKAATSLNHVNEKQRNQAIFRRAVVTRTRELIGDSDIRVSKITPGVRRDLEERFAGQHLPSNTTICAWSNKFRRSGDMPASLISRENLRGRTGSKIDARADELIAQTIESQFKTKKRKNREAIYAIVSSLIKLHNQTKNDDIPIPSRATVYRRIKALRAYDVDRARYGRHYADKKYRLSRKGVEVHTILERVEIDHTPIDAFLIDDATGEVIDRPILTTVIDCYSRMILGFAISIGGTPTWSVKRALYHSIMPKTYLASRYPGKNWEWPCFGVALQYWLDNGSEFHALSLQTSLFDLGADIVFIPRRTPHMHGIVERVQQSINRGLSELIPGKSFYCATERHDYDSVQEARVTISQFEELLHQWIIEVYHNRVHSTIGETPLERWNKKADIVPPLLPPSPDALEFALSEFATRTLSHKGVELNRIQYNGIELQEIRKRYGEIVKVDIRYFPDDLTTIFVSPSNAKDFVKVSAINAEELIGLSLYEHKLHRKGRQKIDGVEHSKAIHRLHQRVDEMAGATTLTRRTQKAKLEWERKAAEKKQCVNRQKIADALAPKVLVDCEIGKED